MGTPLLFFVAILTPLLLAATMLLPPYACIFGAADVIYAASARPQSLMDRAGDVFYILTVYAQLFSYWMAHIMQASFWHFTAPLLGFPAIGLLMAFWITRRLVRGLRHLFHLTTSI